MRFEILLAPEAVEDLKAFKASLRAAVLDSIETRLRHEPRKLSRSRIEQLRAVSQPKFRLGIGEIRVFYDVSGGTVQVLAIVAKSEAGKWLARFGSPK